MISKAVLTGLFLSILSSNILTAQHLSGTVSDYETGEALSSVSLFLVELNRGTTTDERGSFSFPRISAEGSFTLRVQHLGYSVYETEITLPDDAAGEIEVRLNPKQVRMRELIITTSPTGSHVDYQPAQAFNAEDLLVRSSGSFGEMLDGSPGVAMRSFGSVTSRPVIRGLDGDRVLVLRNGERMGDLSGTAHDHSISMEPLAAGRVEVVRGPASLLYGSSALGGVINLINEDIPAQWDEGTTGTAALYGNTGNRGGAGFGQAVYGREHWAVNSSVSYRETGDLSTPYGRLSGTAVRNLTGSAGFGFKGNRTEGGFAISGLDKVYGLPEALDDPDEEIEIRMDNLMFQGRTNWKRDGFINNIQLRMNAIRYFHEEIEIEYDNGTADEDIELSFLQHNLNATVTMRHDPFLFLDTGALGFNSEIRSLRVGGDEALTPDARSQSLAAFIFEEAPLSPSLRLQFGTRMDFRNLDAIANDYYPEFSENRQTLTFSGSIGVNYQPAPNLEFGAQAARAHRAPNLEELYADAPHIGVAAYEVGDPSLGNEIGHGFDLFGRYERTDLSLEIATFYNRINGFIVRRPTGEIHAPSGYPVYEFQDANAELWGGEIILKANLTDHLSFYGSGDYTHGTEIDDNRSPLPFMPPLRGNFTLRYDTGLWWLDGQSILCARQGRTAAAEPETSGYTLLNLSAGYRLNHPGTGNHVISLRLKNIANTPYRDHLSRVEGRRYPMPGRSAHVTYRWFF